MFCSCQGEESEIEEALKFSMDVIGGKFSNAKKDNDFVYHDKVPALESLPEVKGALSTLHCTFSDETNAETRMRSMQPCNCKTCFVAPGASLVKGIPFNPTDPEVSGPDIFQRLVPMEAHEASSLYRSETRVLILCFTWKLSRWFDSIPYLSDDFYCS